MSFLADTAGHYVRYSDGLEEIDPKEGETFQKISDMMKHGADTVHEKYKKPIRSLHAKAHGVIRGKLTIPTGLPEYLQQGLFAKPGTYDVIARLSQAPGEPLDDRKVSSPRGFAIKVLGVEGEFLPGQDGGGTQDFVLATGEAFLAGNASTFMNTIKPSVELAPHMSETTKGIVSDISRGTNAALKAVGIEAGKIDAFGHPHLHPLSETYFSQSPYRFGDYVAKFRVVATTQGLKALEGKTLEPKDENALRTDVSEFFRTHDAEFEFGAQLLTDLDEMPIEDASVPWPQELSPYQTVAKLTFPAQDAFADAEFAEGLSFSPGHSLVEHRGLGSINRARLHTYHLLAAKRRGELGVTTSEPSVA